jgi:hypothetical protein
MSELDAGRNDSWDQTTLEANTVNLKRVVDDYAAIAQQRQNAAGGLQDQLNSLFLSWANDAHTVTQRLASDGANLSQLQANNAALAAQRTNAAAQTWDNFVYAGEVDVTAQGSMANTLAEKQRSVIFEAVQAAVAATTQTTAPAQGTTGVAQGAMQTGAAGVNVALMTELAEAMKANSTVQLAILEALAGVNKAIGVILVKVTGEETTAA